MAAAPASAAARRARTRPPASASARPVLGGNVRWDRLGRSALLIVLIGVSLLYIGPLHSWYTTWQASKSRDAQLHQLQVENKRLKARRAELRNPGAMEREARRLGMVRPGERAYIIDGLPSG
jgi:cell division protein FtsB